MQSALGARSLRLENQFIRVGGDLDPVARLKIPFEDFHGERVQQVFLHGAFERARAECLDDATLEISDKLRP
jgi:hypothetical protein